MGNISLRILRHLKNDDFCGNYARYALGGPQITNENSITFTSGCESETEIEGYRSGAFDGTRAHDATARVMPGEGYADSTRISLILISVTEIATLHVAKCSFFQSFSGKSPVLMIIGRGRREIDAKC